MAFLSWHYMKTGRNRSCFKQHIHSVTWLNLFQPQIPWMFLFHMDLTRLTEISELYWEHFSCSFSGSKKTLEVQSHSSLLLNGDVAHFGDAATRPEFFDDSVASIKFSPDQQHTLAKMKLGGREVLIWKPDGIVDDGTLMPLDVEHEGGDCESWSMSDWTCHWCFWISTT